MEYATQHKETTSSKSSNSFFGKQKEPSFFSPSWVQPKPIVGPVDDPYEREADAVAGKVMRMSDNEKALSSSISVQRKCASCEEQDEVQMKGEGVAAGGMIAPPIVNDVINSTGQPLDGSTRSFMESRFGYDFQNVRVHNDSLAHKSSADINALAYTHRNNIFFNDAQYAPGTETGNKLIAHELTHVIQQSRLVNGQPIVQRDGAKATAAATKLQTAKDKLKAKYGLKDVAEENGAKWTESDLRTIDEDFSKMPKEDLFRLNGVTIILTNDLGSVKGEGKTFKVGGETTGTWQIRFVKGGINKETPLHEVGHLVHNSAVAEVKDDFRRPKILAAFDTANANLGAAQSKAPKWLSGDAMKQSSIAEYNNSINNVLSAITTLTRSSVDTLAANKTALDDALLDSSTYRYALEQYKSDPDAKAYLEVGDRLRDLVVAAEQLMDSRQTVLAPLENLTEFIDIVAKNGLATRRFAPFTAYAESFWPAKPGEFFAECYMSWRNNPGYMKKHGRPLFDWFEKGGYLPKKTASQKMRTVIHATSPVVEELFNEVVKTAFPGTTGIDDLFGE